MGVQWFNLPYNDVYYADHKLTWGLILSFKQDLLHLTASSLYKV